MNITAKEIAELRQATGLPMMECKKALVEAKGDEGGAVEILKKKGFSKAASKSEREVKSGYIDAYLHDGKIGVLVEVLSESDFVAKNADFRNFVHDLALQIASAKPMYVSVESIPTNDIEKMKADFVEEVSSSGKPAEIAGKIVEGKIKKWQSEVCLLDQKYLRDEEKTVGELLAETIAKIGENIVISRFVRYELGE
jgi:elongation factor Ts